MESCKDLQDYALYVQRVRINALTMTTEDAVEDAINSCIRDNILRDFLTLNRAEAKKVSIYEYNEEEHLRMERRDAFEDGFQDGFQKATLKEKANTERKCQRAEQAEAEMEKLKAEMEKLKAEMEILKKHN